ncbi:hypothetical protein DMUE_5481 [Dictyocoela muelleri]|nr:hypothetical protein DMUE_5481 [Dictyocoela muelleri]
MKPIHTLDFNRLSFNVYFDQKEIKEVEEHDLEHNLKGVIKKFKSILGSTDNNYGAIYNKKIYFNANNEWDVSIEENTNNDTTQLIFNLGKESFTLNLSREKIKSFFEEELFERFVIPKNINLIFYSEHIADFKIEYEIQPGYIAIYKENEKFAINIRHIFEFLRGLFVLRMLNIYEIRLRKLQGHDVVDGRAKINFINIYENTKRDILQFYEKDQNHTHFYKASQFISGFIYYKNISKMVKNNLISLSPVFHDLFMIFSKPRYSDVIEIIEANFLQNYMKDSEIAINEIEYAKIFSSLNSLGVEGNKLINPFKPMTPKLLRYVENLEEANQERKLSPLYVEKFSGYVDLFSDDYYGISLERYRQKVIESRKFNAKINEIIVKNIKTISSRFGNKHKPYDLFNALYEEEVKVLNKILNQSFSENASNEYLSNFRVFKIYELISKITPLFNNPKQNARKIKKLIDETLLIMNRNSNFEDKSYNNLKDDQITVIMAYKKLYKINITPKCLFLDKLTLDKHSDRFIYNDFIRDKHTLYYSLNTNDFFILVKNDEFGGAYKNRNSKFLGKSFTLDEELFRIENVEENGNILL